MSVQLEYKSLSRPPLPSPRERAAATSHGHDWRAQLSACWGCGPFRFGAAPPRAAYVVRPESADGEVCACWTLRVADTRRRMSCLWFVCSPAPVRSAEELLALT